MSKYNKSIVYLYGDNSECLGEIDSETLKREWDYFSQFPTIFGTRPAENQAKPAVKTAPAKTLKLV